MATTKGEGNEGAKRAGTLWERLVWDMRDIFDEIRNDLRLRHSELSAERGRDQRPWSSGVMERCIVNTTLKRRKDVERSWKRDCNALFEALAKDKEFKDKTIKECSWIAELGREPQSALGQYFVPKLAAWRRGTTQTSGSAQSARSSVESKEGSNMFDDLKGVDVEFSAERAQLPTETWWELLKGLPAQDRILVRAFWLKRAAEEWDNLKEGRKILETAVMTIEQYVENKFDEINRLGKETAGEIQTPRSVPTDKVSKSSE